jgi:hypothetical protein
MKPFRFLTLFAFISLCGLHPFAQEPACTLSQAPELSGFRLGMRQAELIDVLEDPSSLDSKLSTDKNAVKTEAVNITGAELKEKYAEGVDNVNLAFVDGKLFVIKVTYHGGSGWSSQRDFITNVSEKLNLPKPAGAPRGRGNEKYKVECRSFTATLAYSFGVSPNVTLSDKAAQKMVEERREKNPEGEVRDIRIGPTISRPPKP